MPLIYFFLANVITLINSCEKCCSSISKALRLDGMEANSDDYYRECSLAFLKKEFKNCRDEYVKISNDKAAGAIQESLQKDFDLYLAKLRNKLEKIQNEFAERFELA
jgi:hypothetical protein